ncbi:hypothetical protein AB0G00_23890 [Nocardia salmonicida]|uniref:hypothetical protein n=1 Tax=Nocardia salmonicida TaxID=53431 RepID=UPI0033D6A80A
MLDDSLSLDEVLALKAQGLSGAEIAELRGKTRAAVSYHLSRADKTRNRAPDFPFKVPAKFQNKPYKLLRDHAEYIVSKGKVKWPERRLNRLLGWHNRLRRDNEVLEYNPNIPPGVGDPRSGGGWQYVKRTATDANLIIRVNEFTTMTPRAREIYILPSAP